MRTEKSYVLDPADMECGENREVYVCICRPTDRLFRHTMTKFPELKLNESVQNCDRK